MEGCKIVTYTPQWRGALRKYMHKVFESYSDAYIDYCLDHAGGRNPSLLAVNEKEEIVGCHLYYCTKALVNGEEIETQWGHDTYLNEEYRKEIGVDFLLARKKIPAFGVGLTKTNTKMRKLMKSVFLKGVFNYYTITPAILLSPFQKLFHLKTAVTNVDSVVVSETIFKRVYSSDSVRIPNGGYWYKGYYDLDFIRDAKFLDYRFFKCAVHDYRVYATDEAYFVVRLSSYRGMPALMLSDYRYNPAQQQLADAIMKAVLKLARLSGLGIVYFVCGDKRIDSFFKHRMCLKTPMDFITSYNIAENTSFVLSGGDSDAEFLKA